MNPHVRTIYDHNGIAFQHSKQEMRKMFKKKHNLFLQWNSLGILGCNIQLYCGLGHGKLYITIRLSWRLEMLAQVSKGSHIKLDPD